MSEECCTISPSKIKEIVKMIGVDGIMIMDPLLPLPLLFILTKAENKPQFYSNQGVSSPKIDSQIQPELLFHQTC